MGQMRPADEILPFHSLEEDSFNMGEPYFAAASVL
jgi:hypothetical protein